MPEPSTGKPGGDQMDQEMTRVSDQSQQTTQRVEANRLAEAVKRDSVVEEITPSEVVFGLDGVHVYYGDFLALRGVTLDIARNEITAFIGPSGCGKSTLIRCLNRMNDLIPGARVEGKILYYGQELYAPEVDSVEVRRRIGMVFQKPNPFPKSIYENIAFGPRVTAMKPSSMDDLVEQALRGLCIARAIAVEPDVILMDEPCSALDPVSTARIEDLMAELKRDYTIVIVTHNMQQAARVSDRTAFFTAEVAQGGGDRTGLLVEYDRTETIFTKPGDRRTEDYISGRFG